MNNSTFKGLNMNQNKLRDSEMVSATIKRTKIFFQCKIKFPVSPPFKVFSNDVTLFMILRWGYLRKWPRGYDVVYKLLYNSEELEILSSKTCNIIAAWQWKTTLRSYDCKYDIHTTLQTTHFTLQIEQWMIFFMFYYLSISLIYYF